MELHVYQEEPGFSPFRLYTMVCAGDLGETINYFTSQGYIVVLCKLGRTGVGAHVASRFNQLCGFPFGD